MNIFKIFIITYVILIIALITGWLILYRPIQLGGNTGYFVIATTSMMPTLYPGDLVLTKPATTYHVGDIIAYISPKGIVIVHRIVKSLGNGCYRTKGDANPVVDPWIVCKNRIIGKVVLRIPLVGSLIEEARHSPIIMIILLIVASMVIISPIAIAYGLHVRRNNKHERIQTRVGVDKSDKYLLIIGIALSAICILAIVSSIFIAAGLKYKTEIIRKPILKISIRSKYIVVLKNNTLYNSTILINPEYTYLKILKEVKIRPSIRYAFNRKYIQNLLLRCTISIILMQDRPYGWSKVIASNIPCSGTIILSLDKIKKIIYRINNEVNMFSSKYLISILFRIYSKYILNNSKISIKTFRKICNVEINYIYGVASFDHCSFNIVVYKNVTKVVPRKFRTPFGYLTAGELRKILMFLLVLPLTSMSVIVYYCLSRRREEIKDPVKDIISRYRDIIIEVEEKPKVSGKEIVRVFNFEDLVKLSKIVGKPIFYTVVNTDRGRVHLFYIDLVDKLYAYTIIIPIYPSSTVRPR